jgi:Na+/H+-dicarboxylate symporter
LVAVIGGLPPWIFLKKLVSFLPLPASLGSTNAAMPFSLELCVKKLGVQEKLAGFAIPLGASVKMDGNCAFLIIQSIMLAKLYGVEVSTGFLMTLAFTSIAMSFGSPGVTGGAVICLASVAVSVGIPIEAIGLVLSVDPLVSMLRTPLNSAGGIAATLLLARRSGALDESVYRAENIS